MSIDIFGYIAAFFMAISLIPQVLKSLRTKSTRDISILWTLIYIAGLMFWIIYSIKLPSYPLMFAASIEMFLAVSLLILKLIYK